MYIVHFSTQLHLPSCDYWCTNVSMVWHQIIWLSTVYCRLTLLLVLSCDRLKFPAL